MERLYLLRIGELTLKAGNKKDFEARLRRNILSMLDPDRAELVMKEGRFYLYARASDPERVLRVLARVPGIAAFSEALRTAKAIEAIEEAALLLARGAAARGDTFKVECRRSDKSFTLKSYDLACRLGDKILDGVPGLRVDVKKPSWTLNVEIRDKAYLFCADREGQRGLPVSSSGRGLLLLSGGIDSPVAGYQMMKRGLELEAVHFHSYPYTSEEAKRKVLDLAAVLARFQGPIVLHVIPFTETQLLIKKGAREEARTLMLRCAMMEAARLVLAERNLKCLVTGESLGQVASQTVENIRLTGSLTDYPVLRPLIGSDKEEIIRTARRIGSYEISIQPYEDCCVIFSPPHPLLKADFPAERANYGALGLSEAIAKAVKEREMLRIRASEE